MKTLLSIPEDGIQLPKRWLNGHVHKYLIDIVSPIPRVLSGEEQDDGKQYHPY